jgi:hypothetical protein
LIQELAQQFTALWWKSDDHAPSLGPTYTARQQSAQEAHLKQYLDTLTATLKRSLRAPAERQAAQERILAASETFGRSALGLQKPQRDVILSPGFSSLAHEFIREARRFDPAISAYDVFQAGRNAWVMGGLQLLLGQPLRLTPAMFAYSMLYPYSDNYLDDPAVPPATKLAFQERFTRRLTGERITPANAHERDIYKLVGMIEGQYQRSRYPLVYESLLGIHRAQGKSLSLLRQDAAPYEVDVLGISIAKGGASVLADAYLVSGELGPAQGEFAFGWGTLLQLMDDLQDVEQDRRNGRLTVFSQSARRWPLDALTNRLLHFGERALERLDCFDAPGLEPLKELMHRSAVLLIIDAVGQAGQLYSKPYRRALQMYSPFCFSALKKQRKKLARQRALLSRAFDALAEPDEAITTLLYSSVERI